MTPHGSTVFPYTNFGGGVCVAATTRWLQNCRQRNFRMRPGPDDAVLALQQDYENLSLHPKLEASVNTDYYAILSRVGLHVTRSVTAPNNEQSWKKQLEYMAQRPGLFYCSFNMELNAHAIGIATTQTQGLAGNYLFDPNFGLYHCLGSDGFARWNAIYIGQEYEEYPFCQIMVVG